MTKIVRSKGCGNSPKNALLERVSIALALGDFASIDAELVEDVRWTIVGSESVQGKHRLADTWSRLGRKKIKRILIHQAVNHGKSGAVEGELELSDGRRVAFCDFIGFGSVKGTTVNRVATYAILIADVPP